MIAFKVSLNGTKVCTAGVRDVGVLSAIVTWVRRKPIEVIESETVDNPKRRHRDDPRMVEHAKRRYSERLKKAYGADTKQDPSSKALKPTRKGRG